MKLKLNRTAALTLTGTAILATLSQVGGAADRCLVTTANEVKADNLDNISENTDPSKLSASDFAPGTNWTTAGWTRSNPKYVAKESNISLKPISNTTNDISIPKSFSIKGSWTLDKNDIKKGNRILLSAIQLVDNHNHVMNDVNAQYMNNTDVIYQGEKIGVLNQVFSSDNKEIDYFLDVSETKQYASDPKFTFYMNNAFILNKDPDYSKMQDVNVNPYIIHMISNKNIEKITFKNYIYADTPIVPHIDLQYFNILDPANGAVYFMNWSTNPFYQKNGINVDPNKKEQDFIYKLSGKNIPQGFNRLNMHYVLPLVLNNKWCKTTNTVYWAEWIDAYEDTPAIFKKVENNLSDTDILKQTPLGGISWSLQQDGSVIIAGRITPKQTAVNIDKLRESLNKSYYVNIVDPQHKQQIINDTISYIRANNNQTPLMDILIFGTSIDKTKVRFWNLTDLTPTNLLPQISMSQAEFNPNGQSFNAELYRTALVHYFDSKTGNNISNDSIMGTKNNSTDYKLNIPKGYVLDTKSPQNVDGKQYKWSADKKSIAYTFNEDQKLNDANPINIYITHGTHNTNDNSGKSTRTIQYTGLPDNLKPKDNVQTILFKRSGVTDDVTGETTYGDWQPQSGNGHYTAVTSPTFAGYKPDQAVVPDTAATPNKNETITVNYSRTNQNAKLTVHDDTANTDLNDYAENSTGLYQDQINFKTAPSAVEQELKDKGYNIVSDSFKGSPTYNADDSKNNFVIHVTHKIVPVTPDQPKKPTDVIPDTKQHYPTGVDTNDLNKDVQRSIFYKYEDNSQAEPTVVQKAHFSRTVKVDAVTQKIVDNGTWATKDNYPEVATKSIDGYTPDKTKVDSATPSMTTNQDQTVVYHANDEDAAITYIDDTTGKVLKTDTQKAKYKQAIKFATDPNTQIQTYKDQGYVLVSSDWKDGSTYQTDPARNKFTVHLKHGTSTVTPDKPKKPTDIIPGTKQHYPTGVDTNDLNQPQQRQITYTYADSKKQASPTVTQKATFHRTATVDNVTGKVTYTDWTTSDQYPEVKSPTIEGYTPDKSNIPVTKPVLNTKQDVAVIYNPNPEQVDVIAQDNTGKQLSKSTLHGNYNTDYTATTPVIKGYHLIKMPANTHGTYKAHNDPIIYIYAPDSNSVPEQTDGTPKPDKSSYPNDLTPAKRSTKLPETGTTNFASEINSALTKVIHNLF